MKHLSSLKLRGLAGCEIISQQSAHSTQHTAHNKFTQDSCLCVNFFDMSTRFCPGSGTL